MIMKERTTLEELDFYVDAIDEAKNIDEIFSILERQIKILGFEKFTYWVRWPSFETKNPIFITTYPTQFISHYLDMGYQSHDMVGRFSTEKNTPFAWSDIEKELEITRIQKQLFDESRSIGLRSGGSVPIHGPNLIKATFSVANDAPNNEFEALFSHHKHELQIIGTYAHEKIMALGIEHPLKNIKLTRRESQILTWTARGKTYWEIGAILNIKGDTVRKIMHNALNRLQASNKTHGISKAIVNGLINP